MAVWQNKPFSIDVKKGEKKAFCMCGLSLNGPFCDGSHKATDFSPMVVTFDEDQTVYACGCQQSGNRPYCDGSHNKLKDTQVKASEQTAGLNAQKVWYKVADSGVLSEGDIISIDVANKGIVLSYRNGVYGAIDNACSHQGGPLAEGSFNSNDCLQCPWHGWSFDPVTGKGESGADVACYQVELREDGVYVEVEEQLDKPITVSDIMAETMTNWGVDHVFGMVGHSNLGLAEALRKQEVQGKLRFIGIRHEGAAAFAASGYAKACGRPAACLTIAGPGATNLLTGLWDAKVDRAPILALTGQVNTQVLGPGAFQEVDLASAFEAVSCWSQTVLNDSDHAELMTLALKNAVVNRNVAHLIFPDEVQVLPALEHAKPSNATGRLSSVSIAPPQSSIDECLNEIRQAKQPVIIVGYGARDAMSAIICLAEKLKCAVITTFKAKGQISDKHVLATGVLGRSGTPVSANCMESADLLIVLGASFANHTGINAEKRIIQVDFERMALAKFHPVTVTVWGEIETTVTLILEQLPDKLNLEPQQAKIAKLWQSWREEKLRRANKSNDKGLSCASVFQCLSDTVPKDAIIAVDVGNNTYSFGRYFESQSQKVLMSGYLGSIGFGFPAAMGAWAAFPDKPIYAITGDGGFGQYMSELTTAVKYRMNIKHILLNNSELGKISKEQRAGHWQVWQTSLHNPNFSEYANICGALGIRVTSIEELAIAMAKALSYQGPALIEIITDPELI